MLAAHSRGGMACEFKKFVAARWLLAEAVLGLSLAHLVFCPGAKRRRAAHWDKAGPSLAVRDSADVVPVGGAVPSRDVLTDRVARAAPACRRVMRLLGSRISTRATAVSAWLWRLARSWHSTALACGESG